MDCRLGLGSSERGARCEKGLPSSSAPGGGDDSFSRHFAVLMHVQQEGPSAFLSLPIQTLISSGNVP